MKCWYQWVGAAVWNQLARSWEVAESSRICLPQFPSHLVSLNSQAHTPIFDKNSTRKTATTRRNLLPKCRLSGLIRKHFLQQVKYLTVFWRSCWDHIYFMLRKSHAACWYSVHVDVGAGTMKSHSCDFYLKLPLFLRQSLSFFKKIKYTIPYQV